MNLENYMNVLVVLNYGGKIEVRDNNGEVVSPESVIDFMNDITKKQKEQTSGES